MIACAAMPRLQDEIRGVELLVRGPGKEPSHMRCPRVGHIFILQVGSGPNCQIKDECLANLHASIELHKFSAYIDNHDRVHGTLVNGERVHGRTNLRSGDEVSCGGLVLQIKFIHPSLEGEKFVGDVESICPECKEPFKKMPTCNSLGHWETYAKIAERDRADLRLEVKTLKDEFQKVSVRIGEKCKACGRKDVRLECCALCFGLEEEEIEKEIVIEWDRLPKACPACGCEGDWWNRMSSDSYNIVCCGCGEVKDVLILTG